MFASLSEYQKGRPVLPRPHHETRTFAAAQCREFPLWSPGHLPLFMLKSLLSLSQLMDAWWYLQLCNYPISHYIFNYFFVHINMDL